MGNTRISLLTRSFTLRRSNQEGRLGNVVVSSVTRDGQIRRTKNGKAESDSAETTVRTVQKSVRTVVGTLSWHFLFGQCLTKTVVSLKLTSGAPLLLFPATPGTRPNKRILSSDWVDGCVPDRVRPRSETRPLWVQGVQRARRYFPQVSFGVNFATTVFYQTKKMVVKIETILKIDSLHFSFVLYYKNESLYGFYHVVQFHNTMSSNECDAVVYLLLHLWELSSRVYTFPSVYFLQRLLMTFNSMKSILISKFSTIGLTDNIFILVTFKKVKNLKLTLTKSYI